MLKHTKSLNYITILFVTVLIVAIISICYLVIGGFIGDDKNMAKDGRRVVAEVDVGDGVGGNDSDFKANKKVLGVDTDDGGLDEVYADRRQQASAVFNVIEKAIEDKNAQSLYGVLSEELVGVFDLYSVDRGLSLAEKLSLVSKGTVRLEGEWAYRDYDGFVAGSQSNYTVVLKYENDTWKLYGTTER